MTNKTYAKLTAGLITAWFTFCISASALHLFKTGASRPPLPLLLAVVIPVLLFFVWYRSSTSFREFVLSLNPRTLTNIQSWRIVGFVFLALYTYRILPGFLALPAGWGDIAIGASALFVATKLADPNHKTSFVVWQWLGIADLVSAISLGGLARFIAPPDLVTANGITATPMTVLPLSVIPTFAVPLLLIIHIICLVQARRWPKPAYSSVREHAGSFAG